ncbi:MAG: divalent-cation tolerance protein CutA [Helicobacteraceae bacterium]|jgi:periplasmic divalent cation tolerance protein|nr:divalent-cation tolerance protein CutA [Helicobacteraceae bacterium]
MTIVAMTTIDSEKAAKELARSLVEKRLAACVSIAPNIESLYWWNGATESAKERLLIVKTTAEKIPAIEEFFKEAHPYETPEMIFIECGTSAKYGAWIKDSLGC